MAVELYSTATEYVSNSLTFVRGTAANVTEVGVYHTTDPLEVPAEGDFLQAELILPGDPLAQGTQVDVLTLIGPGPGAHDTLTPGDWQRWIMVKTATEVIIRRKDTVIVK